MFSRTIAVAIFLVSAALPACALAAKPFDEALASAAARMKVKDYSGARQAALKSSQSGPRAFLLGMTDVRLEQWDEAASQLGYAADAYPVLADYALYNQGLALSKLGRNDDALTPLYRLLKQYPDSRLARAATLLYADTLAAGGHHKEALQSYTAFIERYPSGSDSISASFNSALSRDKTGDPAGAAGVLRGIWLNYPGSSFAEKAADELRRLKAAGVQPEAYSTAELFKRAGILYDLGRNGKAAEAYAALLVNSEGPEFNSKLRLRYGQALFKARRYRDAQDTFSSLYSKGTGAIAAEAGYWLARSLDKNGRGDEAYDLYLRLSNPAQGGSVADDSLLEAAYVKRFQKKWSEALQLFKRYLASYPDPQRTATWEAAWCSYQARDYRGAADYLKKLAEREELREKALYWLGKAQAASGDAAGADASYAALATEYPFGYYTMICGRWCDTSLFPAPPQNLSEAIPMPAGYEREKALIALGLYDEAGKELGAKKKQNGLTIARLYLEMGNYNGAYHAVAAMKTKRGDRDNDSVWGFNYPLAFREDVTKNAAANAIPESLVYSIMRAESNYHPGALSPVGAVGLMQIMPATAEAISKGDSGKLARPELNIRLGSRHLKDLLSVYDRNIALTAAAYNAGSGNVKRWQKTLGSLPQDEFVESIPFRETREYVKKVLTAMELYQRLYRLGGKNVAKQQ
jgi:soluble lytic murein transglycosylase